MLTGGAQGLYVLWKRTHGMGVITSERKSRCLQRHAQLPMVLKYLTRVVAESWLDFSSRLKRTDQLYSPLPTFLLS